MRDLTIKEKALVVELLENGSTNGVVAAKLNIRADEVRFLRQDLYIMMEDVQKFKRKERDRKKLYDGKKSNWNDDIKKKQAGLDEVFHKRRFTGLETEDDKAKSKTKPKTKAKSKSKKKTKTKKKGRKKVRNS